MVVLVSILPVLADVSEGYTASNIRPAGEYIANKGMYCEGRGVLLQGVLEMDHCTP